MAGRLLRRARASIARDPAFAAVFAVALAAALVPIFSVRALPFARPPALLAPAGIPLKLVLALSAAALPLALAATARTFGRSHRLALLAFPLVWSASLLSGDALFCVLLSPMLFGVALAGAAEGPRRALRIVAALGAMALACALVLHLDRPPGEPTTRLEPILYLRGLYRSVLATVPGQLDDLAVVSLALSWLLLASGALGEPEPETADGDARARLDDLFPFFIFTAAVVFSFAAGRARLPLLTVAALAGALLPRGPIAGRRALLLAPALFAAITLPLVLAARFAAQLEAAP